MSRVHANHENLLREPLKPVVCGKFQTCRPRRIATTLLPAVLLQKIGLCSEVSDFFPSTSEMMTSHQGSINKDGIHDNIQLSRKHQRAVAGKPNNDPSWSSPHVECTTTVSLRTSYPNAYQPNRALRTLISETFLFISRPGHVGNVFTVEFNVHDLPCFHLVQISINGTVYRKLHLYYFYKLSI